MSNISTNPIRRSMDMQNSMQNNRTHRFLTTKLLRYSTNCRPFKTNSISSIDQPSSKTNYIRKDQRNNNHDHSKRKYSSWYMSICLLAIVILIGGIVAAIVIPVLTRTNPTTQSLSAEVLHWNPNGITVAGVTKSSGRSANKLNLPWDIFVDSSFAIYITDRFNSRVQKYSIGSLNGVTLAGRTDGIAGKSPTTFNHTSGITIDSFRNLYVADMFNHRVQFFLKDNSTGVTIAGNGNAGSSINQLNMPHGLEYDPSSSALYITDTYNHRIMRCSLNRSSCIVAAGGNGQGITRTQLSSPHAAVYHSSSDSLFIANYGGHNIVRWKLGAKNWTLVVGSSNGTSGKDSYRFNGPTDVMLDTMGNIYVADRGNHRIQFFQNGQLNGTTIAGITSKSGANSTMLSYPNSIALDHQLNLYVVDHYNHRIQKFLRY